jgi:hypothetical protein
MQKTSVCGERAVKARAGFEQQLKKTENSRDQRRV